MPASIARRTGGLIAAAALALGAAAPAGLDLEAIAGRYRLHGNELVILPQDAQQARVSLQLEFPGGDMCMVDGNAQVEGDRLVLRPDDYPTGDGGECAVRFWRDGKVLRWTDQPGSCAKACGAGGSLARGQMPLTARGEFSAIN